MRLAWGMFTILKIYAEHVSSQNLKLQMLQGWKHFKHHISIKILDFQVRNAQSESAEMFQNKNNSELWNASVINISTCETLSLSL